MARRKAKETHLSRRQPRQARGCSGGGSLDRIEGTPGGGEATRTEGGQPRTNPILNGQGGGGAKRRGRDAHIGESCCLGRRCRAWPPGGPRMPRPGVRGRGPKPQRARLLTEGPKAFDVCGWGEGWWCGDWRKRVERGANACLGGGLRVGGSR